MSNKKIWLVRTGEILPIDEQFPRLFRMGLIAQICSANPDNEVTWWCSTYNHFKKEFRYNSDKIVDMSDQYRLYLIHSGGYKKNMSFKRLYHQLHEGRRFIKLAEKEDKPDFILCSMPTPEILFYVTKYARKHNIPVYADIRDTFPDMYVDFCADKLKPFMKIGIIPYQHMLSAGLKRCTGICATSEKFLEWGLHYAKREKTEMDRAFYVSYPDNNAVELSDSDIEYWYGLGVKEDDFVCCFFGQFGFTVDLETVMRASLLTAKENPKIKFVICGVGEKITEYKKIISNADNVIFPGWVDRVKICSLGKIAQVGLLSYRPGDNYRNSMPNKFCEYLSLGIVCLIQPEGMMKQLAEQRNCGIHYADENELSKYLLKLAENRGLTDTMKRNARQLYEEKFCAEKVYSEMVAFLIKNT
ncbi:MAG: glycosyltransferase [Oscillospiraceae bacterium]